MAKRKIYKRTAGELMSVLSQVKPETQVVLNIGLAGDGRKKHSPWVETFTTYYEEGYKQEKGRNVVVITGDQEEIE